MSVRGLLSRWNRKKSGPSVALTLLVIGVAGVANTAPANAAVHCNNNGTPNWLSGRFYNQTTSARIFVSGDRLGSFGWYTFSISLPPGTESWAYGGICDNDTYSPNVPFQAYSATMQGWKDFPARTTLKSGAFNNYCYNYGSTIRCSPTAP